MLLSRVSRLGVPTACKQISTLRSSPIVSVTRHSTMRVLARRVRHGHDHDLVPADGDAPVPPFPNGGQSSHSLTNDVEPAVSAAIPVLFKYGDHCRYGEAFAVTGSSTELGSWDPKMATRMKWDHGDVWMAVIHLPAGANTEYKFIKVDANTGNLISWMDDASSPGFNHGNLMVEDGRRTVRGHIAEAFHSIPADYAHLIRQPQPPPAEESTATPVSNEGDGLSEYSDEVTSSEEEVLRDDPPKPPQVEVEVIPHSPGKTNHNAGSWGGR